MSAPTSSRGAYPEAREKVAATVGTRSRDQWVEVFAGTDACVAPVLDLGEALAHPLAAARRI
jgi:alpha-methylacyl-CoA racemase